MAKVFDPAFLEREGSGLLVSADVAALSWAFVGGLIGLFVGWVRTNISLPFVPWVDPLAVIVVGALIGAAYGQSKVRAMRVRGHELLALVAIERNTRPK